MTSSQVSAQDTMDGMDFVDFSEYDNVSSYNSPSVSPHTAAKGQFRPSTAISTPTTLPSSQVLSGPSHQYDQYKQQTPLVPGALASTMAVNQSNSQISGYNLEYLSPPDDVFDFNSAASQPAEGLDMDVTLSSQGNFFFPEPTVNPNAIGGPDSQMPSPTVPSQASNVGRMYPGMHQQQAAALKVQQQQRQQQQQQQQQQQAQQSGKSRGKAPQQHDPIVEAKIAQLLHSMRAKSASADDDADSPLMSVPRLKKDEEDMDEDERLLASEEGKKLSSKERRQLRNKVSARAFRSRRKEYITQLESEISSRVTENTELRQANRALVEENRRLSDLTRTLLSSPAFSSFLETLNAPTTSAPTQQQPQIKVEQRPQEMRKDINPYAQQQQQQQQPSMATIAEQPMDFALMNMENDPFNYQPQVFSVLEMPEMPEIDADMLSGKDSRPSPELSAITAGKTQVPVIESPIAPFNKSDDVSVTSTSTPTSDLSNVDLNGDIYDDITSEPAVKDSNDLSTLDLFGGIAPEKVFARYELVDVLENETAASLAVKRVEQLAASVQGSVDRLNRLTDLI